MSWLERMRATHVGAIATSFGRTFAPGRSGLAGAVFGCPACGATRRGALDPRAAVDLSASGLCFRCHHCGAEGDALDYASWALADRAYRGLDGARRRTVQSYCVRWLGPAARSTPRRPRGATPDPATPPDRPRARSRIAALWSACVRVDAELDVCRYLARDDALHAPIDPLAVADLELARALPRQAASRLQAPLSAHHRLLLPRLDLRGRLRGLVAHRIATHPSPRELLLPERAAGSWLLADGLARHLLATGARPGWWPRDAPLRVIVCDDTLSFLAHATGPSRASRWSDADETVPAVLALDPSAWTQELADRIPDGSVLMLAASESAREKLARAIKPTLRARYVDGRLRIER